MDNLAFTLVVAGSIIAGSGAIVFGLPLSDAWKTTGLIIAAVGAILAVVGVVMTSPLGAALITLVMVATIAIMLRHGWLPKP